MATNNNENKGKKSPSNKPKWALPAMGQAMLNLLEPERAPEMITIHYNGTVTKLLKSGNSESGLYYTGIPQCTNGKKTYSCKFGMTLSTDGYFDGSAALSFITNGGWARGSTKPSAQQKARAREDFICAFLSAAIKLRDHDASKELRDHLKGLGPLEVSEGEMSDRDAVALGLIGVPFYAVELARERGLRLSVDVDAYIGKYVQTGYAKTVTGPWDAESTSVAITSALTESQVMLLKHYGLRFEKVRQFAVKAAAPKQPTK